MALEPRFGRAWYSSGRQDRMLKVAVQCSSDPQVVAGNGVRSDSPKHVDAVLQQVRRRAVFAFYERCDRRILLCPDPCIAKLKIIPGLRLTKADIDEIGMRLLVKVCRGAG